MTERSIRSGRLATMMASLATMVGLLPAAPIAELSRAGPVAEISASVRVPPTPVAGDDGRWYLLYELHIRDLDGWEVVSIDVLEPGETEARVLATFEGELLDSVLFDFIIDYDRRFYYDAFGRTASFRLGGGGERMAYLGIAIDANREPPSRLRHRLTVRNGTGVRAISDGATEVGQAPIVIRSPLTGAAWLARGTLDVRPAPHRLSLVRHLGRVGIHDRYAIDFTVVDEKGRSGPSADAAKEVFFAWGKEVLAVADGVVIDAADGLPDNDPRTPGRVVEITKETLGGNHVVLDIGSGHFAVYAHLMEGSVAVRAGERVIAGQRVGRVGNSGNSNEPHLHFAVASEPSVIAGEGLPFLFDRFETRRRCHHEGDGWSCRPVIGDPVRNRLPLIGSVVSFREIFAAR